MRFISSKSQISKNPHFLKKCIYFDQEPAIGTRKKNVVSGVTRTSMHTRTRRIEISSSNLRHLAHVPATLTLVSHLLSRTSNYNIVQTFYLFYITYF